MNILSVINEDCRYEINNNVYRFIEDESERPEWSKRLNHYYISNNIDLQMRIRYKQNKQRMKNPLYRKYFDYISENNGVLVDLASGPSGYFSPLFDKLCNDTALIVTDACPAVLHAHSAAWNDPNYCVFDMDLDKELPFRNESISAFSGNLLNNVDNYSGLIKEVYRCLKPEGRFAVIEMFFEQGCKTSDYLVQQNTVWSSFETFVDYCMEIGFHYVGSDMINKRKGKISKDDLFPLDDHDVSVTRTVYFTK